MEMYLSLSGERPDAPGPQGFAGVGMIRVEYLMRAAEEYITVPACRERVEAYVEQVAVAFAPRPVWVRQGDLTTLEVNTLRGADDVLLEKTPLLGLRGIRRGLEYPETMRAEVQCALAVARRHPNVHYMFSYLGNADEFLAGRSLLAELGWPNRVGTMIEVPSAAYDVARMVDAGASLFMLGTNDMTSLLTGQQRRSDRGLAVEPALRHYLRRLRREVPAGLDLGIAGYLTSEALREVADEGYSYCSVHYADAPAVLGMDADLFPDRDHMQRVKALTRTRVAQWQRDHYRNAPATAVAQDARISLLQDGTAR